MGLAPSGNGENPGESAFAKVPVPIFHSLVAFVISKVGRGPRNRLKNHTSSETVPVGIGHRN